jgi:hypothetical protein
MKLLQTLLLATTLVGLSSCAHHSAKKSCCDTKAKTCKMKDKACCKGDKTGKSCTMKDKSCCEASKSCDMKKKKTDA